MRTKRRKMDRGHLSLSSFSMSEGMLWSQTWRVWTYLVFRIPPSCFDLVFAGTGVFDKIYKAPTGKGKTPYEITSGQDTVMGTGALKACLSRIQGMFYLQINIPLDGCDAMATLLFSCKLHRSLLSVRSPAKSPTHKPLAMEAYKG